MFQAFVYRLYPSKSQRARLEAVRETCRHFYNACRRERKEAYEERGETISQTVQLRKVKVEKATSPYALDIHSHILQNVAADLDKAFEAFFRRVKAGENPGYPRFKVRNRFAGFGFKEYGNGFKVEGRRLKLSGIGRIAVRWHRKLEGTIKTARVFCRAGKWFVAFSCEVEKPEPLPKTGESIGIDLGLMRLATFSNGEKKENPRWYRGILRELRVLQRKIARCVLGSRNRRRLILRLQRLMVHVANARNDFLNKFVHELITRFDRIVLEDPRVAVPGSSIFRSGIVGSNAIAACPLIGTTTPRSSSSKGAGMSPWALSLPTGGFAQKPHDFSRGGVFTPTIKCVATLHLLVGFIPTMISATGQRSDANLRRPREQHDTEVSMANGT